MSGHRLTPAERATILRWRQAQSLSVGDIRTRCRQQGWANVPSKSTLSLLLQDHPRSPEALRIRLAQVGAYMHFPLSPLESIFGG